MIRITVAFIPQQSALAISVSKVKVKSNYFIVRPKVGQRAGLLSLPHLGIFAIHTRYFLNLN